MQPLQQIEADKQHGETKESLRQVACADIVLINKVDLAKSEDVTKLKSTITALNPTAPIVQTVKGEINLARILSLQAYTKMPEFVDSHPIHEDHVHDENCSHLNDITSLAIPLPRLTPTQVKKLDEWIRSLLWEGRLPPPAESRKVEVLRCKGIWWTTDGKTFVLQGVRSLYETYEEKAGSEEETSFKDGKIVLIGKGLDNEVPDNLKAMLGQP